MPRRLLCPGKNGSWVWVAPFEIARVDCQVVSLLPSACRDHQNTHHKWPDIRMERVLFDGQKNVSNLWQLPMQQHHQQGSQWQDSSDISITQQGSLGDGLCYVDCCGPWTICYQNEDTRKIIQFQIHLLLMVDAWWTMMHSLWQVCSYFECFCNCYSKFIQ